MLQLVLPDRIGCHAHDGVASRNIPTTAMPPIAMVRRATTRVRVRPQPMRCLPASARPPLPRSPAGCDHPLATALATQRSSRPTFSNRSKLRDVNPDSGVTSAFVGIARQLGVSSSCRGRSRSASFARSHRGQTTHALVTKWRRWDSNPRPPACKYGRKERRRTRTARQHGSSTSMNAPERGRARDGHATESKRVGTYPAAGCEEQRTCSPRRRAWVSNETYGIGSWLLAVGGGSGT